MEIRERHTESETSALGNVLSTSKKLAEARNFFAVDLFTDQQRKYSTEKDIPRCPPTPVFLIGVEKDLERKVLDVSCARRLNIDGVIRANGLFHRLQRLEQREEKVPGGSIAGLDSNPQLRSVISA